MTKQEIQAALNEVPANLVDASPSVIKKYFAEKFSEKGSEAVDLLTANYLLLQVDESLKHLEWYKVKNYLINKYEEISLASPDYELFPLLDVVHTGNKNGLCVTAIS
jgi:hypothetical protein